MKILTFKVLIGTEENSLQMSPGDLCLISWQLCKTFLKGEDRDSETRVVD